MGVDDVGVVDAISDAARRQNVMCARELAAVGELYARRAPEDDVDRENWAIDGHENVVAEIAAALYISRGRARGRLRYAIVLRERLPRVAEVFARGLIDFRMMAAVVSRTELIEDPTLIAKLDAAIATHAPNWMRLSGPKLLERIDMWVIRFDPAGKRVPGQHSENRYVEIAPTDRRLGRGLGTAARYRWRGLGSEAGCARPNRLRGRSTHQAATSCRRAGRFDCRAPGDALRMRIRRTVRPRNDARPPT